MQYLTCFHGLHRQSALFLAVYDNHHINEKWPPNQCKISENTVGLDPAIGQCGNYRERKSNFRVIFLISAPTYNKSGLFVIRTWTFDGGERLYCNFCWQSIIQLYLTASNMWSPWHWSPMEDILFQQWCREWRYTGLWNLSRRFLFKVPEWRSFWVLMKF